MGRHHNPPGGEAWKDGRTPRPAAVLVEACREDRWPACRATLTGHTSCVNNVAISPDGATLVSSSGDKTVRVWDVASGECRAVLKVGLNRGCVVVCAHVWKGKGLYMPS